MLGIVWVFKFFIIRVIRPWWLEIAISCETLVNLCYTTSHSILELCQELLEFIRYASLFMPWSYMTFWAIPMLQVDNVQHPSWQAQLRGRKKWILEPPPECYYQCSQLEVVVEPGEISEFQTDTFSLWTFSLVRKWRFVFQATMMVTRIVMLLYKGVSPYDLKTKNAKSRPI
jgi:hypothetical protein